MQKVTFGRHIDQYSNNNIDLENVETIKDVGVTLDSHLKFDLHINEKVNKT